VYNDELIIYNIDKKYNDCLSLINHSKEYLKDFLKFYSNLHGNIKEIISNPISTAINQIYHTFRGSGNSYFMLYKFSQKRDELLRKLMECFELIQIQKETIGNLRKYKKSKKRREMINKLNELNRMEKDIKNLTYFLENIVFLDKIEFIEIIIYFFQQLEKNTQIFDFEPEEITWLLKSNMSWVDIYIIIHSRLASNTIKNYIRYFIPIQFTGELSEEYINRLNIYLRNAFKNKLKIMFE